jgi:hypothetical protein
MDPCELQQIDNYVDSILKNVNINKMLETLDMNEIDRYVDTILKSVPVHDVPVHDVPMHANNLIEEYEVIELKRPPTIHYKRYNKKKSKQCTMQ